MPYLDPMFASAHNQELLKALFLKKSEGVFNLLNLPLSSAHVDIAKAFFDALLVALIAVKELNQGGLLFECRFNLVQKVFMGFNAGF